MTIKRIGRPLRIGLIADTHGVVHPGVSDHFRDTDHIVHAGDIGGEHVLSALRAVAPVTFVYGNNDDHTGEDILRVTLGGVRILLTHILPRPRTPGRSVVESLGREPADLVLFGHSHLPHNEIIDDILYFNPASAGPKRFDYPISLGLLEILNDNWRVRHIALDDRSETALQQRMNQLSRSKQPRRAAK